MTEETVADTEKSPRRRAETTRKIFRVDRKEIHYFKYTLESYDGMAVVSTLDPHKALIEVAIAPGCEELVLEILNAMREEEHLNVRGFLI